MGSATKINKMVSGLDFRIHIGNFCGLKRTVSFSEIGDINPTVFLALLHIKLVAGYFQPWNSQPQIFHCESLACSAQSHFFTPNVLYWTQILKNKVH